MNTDPRGRIVQPSALHPSPGLHRRDLPPIDLVRISGEFDPGVPNSGRAEFAVTTPEVRCRVRGELIFVPDTYPTTAGEIVDRFWPDGGVPNPSSSYFGTTALWLAKRSEDANGSAERVPTENLVGSRYAFRTIPDPGCLGFNFEVETCADELWGRMFIDGQFFVGFAGKWILRASIGAYEHLTETEWNRVLGRFSIRALVTCAISGGGRPV